MEVVLLVDASLRVPRWQFDALRSAQDKGVQVVLVARCLDDNRPRLRLRELAYRVLAFLGPRRRLEVQEVSLETLIAPGTRQISFEAIQDGVWQRIPDEVSAQFQGADVVIKFGMKLLRDPDLVPVPGGVVSYHHGDPSKYRGRPAGFYEILFEEPVVGIIVQRISNRLDGGQVLASGFSRVVPHSYAKTLGAAFESGVPLLAQALCSPRNEVAEPSQLGKNYTIPGNLLVLRFAWRLMRARLKRAAYGALWEKDWRIAFHEGGLEFGLESLQIRRQELWGFEASEGFAYLADPCGPINEGVLCEGLNNKSGKGSILFVSNNGSKRVRFQSMHGHMSYPQIIECDEGFWLLPEMASIGAPTIFAFDPTELAVTSSTELVGLERERVVDGTLFLSDGIWFLFGTRSHEGSNILRLWSAPALSGPYEEHPHSPVCIDPRRARMAGPILQKDDRLYRFGQDISRGYGRAITVNEIGKLDPENFCEVALGTVSICGALGPHTLAQSVKGGFWLDFYEERFTVLAGFRRLLAKLSR